MTAQLIHDRLPGLVALVSDKDVAKATTEIHQARVANLENKMADLIGKIQGNKALASLLEGVLTQINALVALLPAESNHPDDRVPDTREIRQAAYDAAYAALPAELLLPMSANDLPAPTREELAESTRMVEYKLLTAARELASDMVDLKFTMGKHEEASALRAKFYEALGTELYY